MAKVPFTKLALKKQDNIKTINIDDNISIEVKQYLPINEKAELISNVINSAHEDKNYANPLKVEMFGTLEIIFHYTNLSFTDKQREDLPKLYDLLFENGIVDKILSVIPEDEYNFIINNINETINSVYQFENSVLGIIESVATDYNNLNFDADSIQKKLADPENLTLLKGIMTQLG